MGYRMTIMRKRRKILYTLISIAGLFLCVFIILLIVTPQLINLETVKEHIRSQYARDMGGEIEYQRLDLAVFPVKFWSVPSICAPRP